ncbi:hypothetical protein K435DRAFT_838017 [Dendrothele bispora CBS 962.96]|uniref:COP9 signalosome complex subunit 3 N-terminal helical repeats domain-containing protein n=1 Tax=Dendrothele bispora (strain CBS 962.96) TaxID=1314807 RepID=A0A4S8M8Z9_DENBC|nr:hypothetical protein K435DRAFT_838017 [Dendrothele bispora CBS 962.96]
MASAGPSSDDIIQAITTTSNINALAQNLRAVLPKDVREILLASPLSSGQDPLGVLHLSNNTLGVLYILSARLTPPTDANLPPPSWALLTQFCNNFIPEQARLAPERMTLFAKGIIRFAASINNAKQSIPLLMTIVNRFPPTPSTLTAIHPLLVHTALQTNHIPPELPTFLINHPPDNILLESYPDDASLTSIALCNNPSPDLTSNDNLTYHYLAGIILALTALSSSSSHSPTSPSNTTIYPSPLTSAMDYLETVVTAPQAPPSGSQNNTNVHALQLEALKKLRLLQCIALGAPQPLPKYANQTLNRLFKNTPYYALVNAFPLGRPIGTGGHVPNTGTSSVQSQIHASGNLLLNQALKDRPFYTDEYNWGLVERVVRHAAPRWALKRLTETYVTLGLKEIARHLPGFFEGAEGRGIEEEVTRLVVSMVEEGMIRASISVEGDEGGIVTFYDEFDEAEDEDGEDDIREIGKGALSMKEEQLRILLGVPVSSSSSLAPSDKKPSKGRQVKVQIQTLLAAVQAQSEQLSALDREFEKSRDFLTKAHKLEKATSGGLGGGPSFFPGAPGGIPGLMGDEEELYERYGEEGMYS